GWTMWLHAQRVGGVTPRSAEVLGRRCDLRVSGRLLGPGARGILPEAIQRVESRRGRARLGAPGETAHRGVWQEGFGRRGSAAGGSAVRLRPRSLALHRMPA